MQHYRSSIKDFLTVAKLLSDQNKETLLSYLIQMALLEVGTPEPALQHGPVEQVRDARMLVRRRRVQPRQPHATASNIL